MSSPVLPHPQPSRRSFLKTAARGSSVLVVGFYCPPRLLADTQEAMEQNPFNAWVLIASDGTTTLVLAKSEMGQGVFTSLPQILADELEADWKTIRVEQARTNTEIYDNLGTGGSGSVLDCFLPLRQAGAAARSMLIEAAAKSWGVDPVTCFAKQGYIVHNPRGHSLSYAELVEKASRLPVPDLKSVKLKNPSQFRFIGQSLPHLDIPEKVDGSAVFGIDVRVPGMAYAVVARCPVFGGRVKSFDASKTKAVPGVIDVFEIPAVVAGSHTAGGVAVVADSTWTALEGRQALRIEWDKGPAVSESSASLRQQLKSLVAKTGKVVRNDGDAESILSGAKVIEAEYELPFLAHATMEPMNSTADVRSDRVEVWAPTQGPEWVQDLVAQVSGIPKRSVNIRTTLMGGGFGRRYQTDFAVEATQISQAVGKPVHLQWTREDDMQHDFYRPAFRHRLTGALDPNGGIRAWRHRISSTPIAPYWRPDAKPEESEIGSASFLPYAIANFRLEYSPADSSVPRAWWRSVEESSSAFAVESFLDELAAAARVDPLEFRLRLLSPPRKIPNFMSQEGIPLDSARFKAVLQLAADQAGWKTPPPSGRFRGIAAFYSFNTYAAHVVEVSVAEGGKWKLDRVTAAVDCGRAVDPQGVKAQIESGIVYGLSAILTGEITIGGGAVEQTNFNDYPVLRLRDMPEVEVHILDSTARPTGVGEPGLPPLAPAIANALFAATGKRARRLPIRSEDLV
jgi:isoquinoline 1-oxidoreductase subunit beta